MTPPLFFGSLALVSVVRLEPDRELATRRVVPLRARADVPGGRCSAVDASIGSRDLTHERGEVSNMAKKGGKKKGGKKR